MQELALEPKLKGPNRKASVMTEIMLKHEVYDTIAMVA